MPTAAPTALDALLASLTSPSAASAPPAPAEAAGAATDLSLADGLATASLGRARDGEFALAPGGLVWYVCYFGVAGGVWESRLGRDVYSQSIA